MGLKWFRASLSMEQEGTKVPEMTGMYRRVSYFESAFKKNAEFSAASSSITSDSIASDETMQYDRTKSNLTSQLSSLITDSEEITVKDNDKKLKINPVVENAESSTSTKHPNVKDQSTSDEESNKINKDHNDTSDIKSPIYPDNELVI